MINFISMQKIRSLPLLLVFILCGCAAPQYKTTYETRENGTGRYFESTNQTSSLYTVTLSPSGLLTIDSYITSYDTEYEGPKMEEVSKVRRPADPIGAIVNTAATVGLNLLFEPKKTGSQAIGDTRGEYVTRTYVDKSRSRTTGRANWNTKSTIFNGSILVFGIKDQPIELYVTNNYIDISSHLKESNLSSPLRLRIVCKNCQDLRVDQNASFANYTREKNLNFNLDEFKILQRNAIRNTQGKSSPATNSVNQRCLSIGLREGSDDFIKCVKTLTK